MGDKPNHCSSLSGRLRAICEGTDRRCRDECRRIEIQKLLQLRLISQDPDDFGPPPDLPPAIIPGMGKGLGDRIEEALTAVGITKERVEAFVGAPCGCAERREKLNALGAWASRVLKGAKENAVEFLNKIIGESK